MNPLSMESMFLILSGVILASGVLYWFWSHIQLTQKKVQLLENAVFELRSMLSPGLVESGLPNESQEQPEYKDLEDDDWTEPQVQVQAPVPVQVQVQEPATITIIREEPAHVDFMAELQARESLVQTNVVTVNDNVNENENDNENDNDKTVETEDNQTLEGLTLKVLRSMASQRGITGTSDMKKKDVIAALRGTV